MALSLWEPKTTLEALTRVEPETELAPDKHGPLLNEAELLSQQR